MVTFLYKRYYNAKEHSWNKLGNMRGRSYFLKTCYRTVKEIAHMALKFLQQNESLQEGGSRFYKSDDEDTIQQRDLKEKL